MLKYHHNYLAICLVHCLVLVGTPVQKKKKKLYCSKIKLNTLYF